MLSKASIQICCSQIADTHALKRRSLAHLGVMGEPVDDAEQSDGSYDSDVTGSSGSESESDTFSPQQPAQVSTVRDVYMLPPVHNHMCPCSMLLQRVYTPQRNANTFALRHSVSGVVVAHSWSGR